MKSDNTALWNDCDESCRVRPNTLKSRLLAVLIAGFAIVLTGCIETTPLWRVEVRTTTCDISKAGTDDSVWVRLTDSNSVNSKFFLNKGEDDFNRNETDRYDVMLPGISSPAQITEITIGRTGGSDAVCISRVELLLNRNPHQNGDEDGNSLVFSRDVGEQWIDADGTHPSSFTISDIRSDNPLWNLEGPRATIRSLPIKIGRETLEQLTEATIGNQISHPDGQLDGKLKWGDRKNRSYVELTRNVTESAVRVDLDMNRSGKRKNKIQHVDVDFTLWFYCNGPQLLSEISDVDADASGFFQFVGVLGEIFTATLGLGGINIVSNYEDTASAFKFQQVVIDALDVCVPPTFDENQNLSFL